MAQYPQQSFDAMRQDAIRRSREMQRQAMPPPPAADIPAPPPEPVPEPIPMPEAHAPQSNILEHLHLSDDMKKMLTEWDGEKLALLGLLYLLYKEGAELELLIAIAYVML